MGTRKVVEMNQSNRETLNRKAGTAKATCQDEEAQRALESPMRRFRAYSEYKDSDMGLVKIPKDWNVTRFRFLVETNPTKREIRHLSPDTSVSFVAMESVGDTGALKLDATRKLTDIQEGYTYFRNGDVIVAKITPCFENGKGALAIELENGIAFGTTELDVLRPRSSLEAKFLFYVTTSHYFRKSGASAMYGAGGQKRIPVNFVRNFHHPFPERIVQQRIAAFLDRETSKIDTLSARKERLIELLKERRTALVDHVITKGLDPMVPMKDSGFERLGAIPEHWKVKRLWHLTPSERRIMYGIVLPGSNVSEGVPIVKGGDVAAGRLRLSLLNRTSFEIEAGYERSRLRGGDLVIAIRGSIGDVAVVPDELAGANLTQDAARVAYGGETCGAWLLYALRSDVVFTQLDAGCLGATIKGINIRDLKRALLPVPPKREQEAIAAFLDNETRNIDDLILSVRKAIERLKELRSALISAAVTGKIDVLEEMS
jgi:type I restriction enzyme S subunit